MRIIRLLALSACAAFSPHSSAGLVVNVDEVAGSIVLSYSGTLDLSSTASKDGDRNNGSSFVGFSGGEETVNLTARAGGNLDDYNVNVTSRPSPNMFGSANLFQNTSQSGDEFLFQSIPFGFNQIWVPDNYVSGDSISGSVSFGGVSFSSPGIEIYGGSFTWAWSNGSASDSITFNVSAPPRVPEPGAFALLAGGVVGLAIARRRRPSLR